MNAMNAELDTIVQRNAADDIGGNADVDEYRRRLAGETRTSMEALQRSLGSVDAPVVAPDVPEGVEVRYGYRVGEIGLLHDPDFAVQVSEIPPMFALPNTRSWCLGLTNLRGNLTPVYDLAALMGMEMRRRRNKLLVIGADSDAVAILTNDTPTQVRIEIDKGGDAPADLPDFLRKCLRASYTVDDGHWFELDYGSLFSALQELAEIS